MEEKKYLTIRNWDKFQSTTDKHGKSMEGRGRPYIRDYCDKETDSLYASLTLVQRYMIDACRRLRGKHGRNLQNDPMWIMRQLDVDPAERSHGVKAVHALIKCGFLIPTNQQLDIPQQPETPVLVLSTDKGRSNEQNVQHQNANPEPTTTPTAGTQGTAELHNSQLLAEHRTQIKPTEPQNGNPPKLSPGTGDLPSVGEIVEEIIQPPEGLVHLFEQLVIKTNPLRKKEGKRPADIRPQHWQKTWKVDFMRLLASGYTYKQITQMITLAFGPRWLFFTFRPKNIVDNADKLAADLKIPVQFVIPEKTYRDKLAEIRERNIDAEATQFSDAFKFALCAGGCGKNVLEADGPVCDPCLLRLHPNAYIQKMRDPDDKNSMIEVVQYRCMGGYCSEDGTGIRWGGLMRWSAAFRIRGNYHSPQRSLQGLGQEAVASHVFWGQTKGYTGRPPRLPLPACTDSGVIHSRRREKT